MFGAGILQYDFHAIRNKFREEDREGRDGRCIYHFLQRLKAGLFDLRPKFGGLIWQAGGQMRMPR